MATDAEESGFLSRWARRKAQVRQGTAVDDAAPPAPPPAAALPSAAATAASAALAAPSAPESPAAAAPAEPAAAAVQSAPPPPTLDDVAALTHDSDYRRFVGRGVDPEVRNAALGKLFTDPHFNVMDGLDTYIDDYGKPDPLPPGMLRQLAQSRLLGLFDDDAEDVPTPARHAAPQTPEQAAETPPDEDTDLRLQPDDGAGHTSAAPGAGEDPGRQH